MSAFFSVSARFRLRGAPVRGIMALPSRLLPNTEHFSRQRKCIQVAHAFLPFNMYTTSPRESAAAAKSADKLASATATTSCPLTTYTTVDSVVRNPAKHLHFRGDIFGIKPALGAYEEEKEEEEEEEELEDELDVGDALIAVRHAVLSRTASQHLRFVVMKRLYLDPLLQWKGTRISNKIGFRLSQADVDALVAAASVSGYGDLRTQTTVVDTAVRDALEIRYDADAPTYIKVENGALRSVVKDLLRIEDDDVADKLFTLVPQKLNIYRPGGHFETHVDTPTSPNMVGTAILCIPTELGCVGGELLVWPPGDAATDDKRAEVWDVQHPADSRRYWTQGCSIAFWGDCKHRVCPVTDGVRITFTFAIVMNANVPYEPAAPDVGDVDASVDASPVKSTVAPPMPPLTTLDARLDAAVQALVQHSRFFKCWDEQVPEGGKPPKAGLPSVGFVLRHGYPLVQRGSQPALKGVDAMVVPLLQRAFAARGWSVALSHVVLYAQKLSDFMDGDDDPPKRTHGVYDIALEMFQGEGGFVNTAEPQPFTYFTALDERRFGNCLHNENIGGGYTGNDCNPDISTQTYCALALIASPPSSSHEAPAKVNASVGDTSHSICLQ